MMEQVNYFLGALCNAFATYYVIYKLMGKNIKISDKKFLSVLLFHTLFICCFYFITDTIVRVVLIYLLMIGFEFILFRKELLKNVLCAFITYIYIFVSEMLFMAFIMYVLNINIESFKKYFFVQLITNFTISAIMIILIKIKPITSRLSTLISNITLNKKKKYVVFSILTFTVLVSILYCIYFETAPVYTLLLNLMLILLYSSLTVMLFKESSDKVKIASKYDNMVNTSEKYEKVVEQLRMNNHENKNNLIVLKGMLSKKDKKVKEYIDNLLNSERIEDNDLILKTNSIPTGGLQGLIYQKLLDMKESNICYYLEVSKNIPKKKIEELDIKTNKDLCTIVGIFLDNAIQETQNIDEKNIGIYLYQEQDYFVISISNNYQGKIDLQRMNEKGYTTKEEGHGYGLSLVKEIIDKNIIFKNEKSICGNVFIQKIKINLNKK